VASSVCGLLPEEARLELHRGKTARCVNRFLRTGSNLRGSRKSLWLLVAGPGQNYPNLSVAMTTISTTLAGKRR
jgi:hypothetical protein